jgi:hypothetical protein
MFASLAVSVWLLAGCGPVKLSATANIPTPLIVKIPVAVALYVPKDFSEYAHKEERWGTKWDVSLGKAQSEGLTRLLSAMFERVVVVDSVNAGAALGDVRAILEPSVEEYAFVTPRDAGSPFYAVSIKYRVNVYSPDGRLADSWGFTGYGTSQSEGISSSTPMAAATALALRDAGAKLAVEFREQAIVRGLLPEAAQDNAGAAPSTMPPAPANAQPPASDAPKPATETPPATPPQPQPATEAPATAPPSESQPTTQAPAPGAPANDAPVQPAAAPPPQSAPATVEKKSDPAPPAPSG